MTAHPKLAPAHLVAFLSEHKLDATFVDPGVPMPTVPSAAAAVGAAEESILKTLLFVGECGNYAIAIANGTARVDRQRLAAVSGLKKPRAAKTDDVIAVTGYPAGGVAPLALAVGIPVFVDTAVAALPCAYGGGGHETLLLRVRPADVVRLNRATVASIVARS